MKNLVKVLGSVILTASMLLSMTGCSMMKEMREARVVGDEIMEYAFDLKGSKLAKYFNEDDDLYDYQVEMIEATTEDFDTANIEFKDMKSNKTHIDYKNGVATIDYAFPIKGGDTYEFQLVLEKDGDDWVIEDNEEFIVNYVNFVMEIYYEEGDKDDREFIEEVMDAYGVSKVSKIGQAYYDKTTEWL